MTILRMETDSVRDLVNQFQTTTNSISDQVYGLHNSAEGVEWASQSRDQFLQDLTSLTQAIRSQLEAGSFLANRVSAHVTLWEQAAAALNGSASGNGGLSNTPQPIPVPTPSPGPAPFPGDVGSDLVSPQQVAREIFDFLENLSKPVGWVSSKQLHEIFKEIGRILNRLGNTRGNVGQMDAFAGLLEGSAEALDRIGTILSADDYRRYINGEMTNAEIIKTAFSNFPFIKLVPFLGEAIANKLLPFLPNPEGKWKGLVPPAY